MRDRCLPCHLIIRNVCIVLMAVTGTMFMLARVHSDADGGMAKSEALQKLVFYRIALEYIQR